MPCCESLRQQHPNNSKQHGALAKMGNMQAGLETLNQQRCSPRSCHSVGLAKALRFVKAVLVLAKKVTAAISFSGRKHISFLDSKKWSSPVFQQVMKLARHKKHYCSCTALHKVPAPQKNSMHRCHCQLMKKSQIIKTNSKSTSELPMDYDDWKRTSERNLRGL